MEKNTLQELKNLKEIDRGSVIMTDVENQKKSLVGSMELQAINADSVDPLIERDDEEALRKLIEKWSLDQVWRPEASIVKGGSVSTSLHECAKKEALKCLRVLLDPKPPKDVLDAPDEQGRTPLLVAVEEARPKVVKMLLDAGAHVNARNDRSQSSLHLLAYAVSKGAKPESALQAITELLLSHRDIDLEPYAWYTPLAIAASKLPQGDGTPRSGGLINFCRELVRAGASLEAEADKGTVEEVLQRKKALPAILMGMERRSGDSAPKRPTASEFLDMIGRGRNAQEIEAFLRMKSREEVQNAVRCRLGKRTALFYAVDIGDELLVKVLIENGASSWSSEVTSELPIHRALSKGHLAILNLLIDHMKDGRRSVDLQDYSFSLIRKVLEKTKKNAKESEPGVSHFACLQRLMKDDVIINVNQELDGMTVLHLAAAFNNQDAVCELLRKGAFLGARRRVLGDDRGNVLDSILLPTLERTMDGCITHDSEKNDTPEDVLNEDYTLRLDYRFLVPPVNDDKKGDVERINEMETLMDIGRSHRHRHALTHPLIQTLLYAKWRKALPLYIFNLGLYLLFVVILTAYVYCLTDLRVLEAQVEKLNLTMNATVEQEKENKQATVHRLMGFLLPLTLYMVVREMFQIFLSREMYLKSIENYLECFLVIVVFVLVIARLDVDVTRHISAWAMIVAWYEFVLVLGRSPHLSIYITMLRQVSWNYLKVIYLFSALIVAFTVSFNIILSGSEDGSFSDFWSALPKAIVMATGEFEYSDLSERFSKRTFLVMSDVLIFLVFLFLIFLILMNVINALAVKDTQEVIDDALLFSLTSILELVYLTESLFLRCPGLQSHIDRLQLLSGAKHKPILLAKLNERIKKERLRSGKMEEFKSKLDDGTVQCLRVHRLKSLEEKDPMDEIRSLLQELKDISKQCSEQH